MRRDSNDTLLQELSYIQTHEGANQNLKVCLVILVNGLPEPPVTRMRRS